MFKRNLHHWSADHKIILAGYTIYPSGGFKSQQVSAAADWAPLSQGPHPNPQKATIAKGPQWRIKRWTRDLFFFFFFETTEIFGGSTKMEILRHWRAPTANCWQGPFP